MAFLEPRAWRITRRAGDDEIAQLRQQIKALTRELKAAQARIEKLTRAAKRHDADRDALKQMRDNLDDVVRKYRRMKHRMLSHAPLAGLMAARRRFFPPDAWRADAEAREAAFSAASASYRAALAMPWPRAGVQSIDLSGLRLWVPLDGRQPERLLRASSQDIPFSVILQTREVAIGGLMLDIGANLGRTSLPRVLLGDVRAVYAAEADEDNYQCLVHAVADNGLRGFVLPDHLAISAVDGTATLRKSRFVGGHRLLKHVTRPVETATVRTRRIDTWLSDLGVDPGEISFVKVDVQGWETEVLQGACGLLSRRSAAWQLEVDPGLLRAAGSDPRDLIAAAQRHFTHFVDLVADSRGLRHRSIGELPEALEPRPDGELPRTDLIFYCCA